LTKPEVNLLIALTTFVGFCLARQTQPHAFLVRNPWGPRRVLTDAGVLSIARELPLPMNLGRPPTRTPKQAVHCYS
jgi:hypothetical protein